MRRVVRTSAALALIAALALAIAGCKGGKSSSDRTATAQAGGAARTAPAGKTSAPESAGGGGGVASADELDAVASRFERSIFKADYRLSSSGGDNPFDGAMTLYKSGNDRFRFDINATQDGQPVQLVLIDTADVSAFCLQNAGDLGALLGVPDDQGVCFRNDPTAGAGGIQDLADSFKNLSSADVNVTGKSSRQILGQDTTCYAYTDNRTGDVSETCFSGDGVPLYDKTTSGAETTTIEATQVAGSVADGDFTPPYELRDLPSTG
jgi:hypothetical protein